MLRTDLLSEKEEEVQEFFQCVAVELLCRAKLILNWSDQGRMEVVKEFHRFALNGSALVNYCFQHPLYRLRYASDEREQCPILKSAYSQHEDGPHGEHDRYFQRIEPPCGDQKV